MKARSLVLVALLNPICNCFAQIGVASSTEATNQPMKGVANSVIPVTLLTNREFLLSIIVLTFGLSVLIFQYALLKHSNASANDVIKGLSLTLIVVGVLFSMTAGFDAQTIAPAIGLLGTIAGYLLGRKDDSSSR